MRRRSTSGRCGGGSAWGQAGLFWDASQGQMQYGRIFVGDESVGADSAEVILHASGDPSYATWGKFGIPGQALRARRWPMPGSASWRRAGAPPGTGRRRRTR